MKLLKILFAKIVLKLWGWQIQGSFPRNIGQMIIIVAPHTHHFFGFGDVLLGWCVKEVMPIPRPRFLVKHEAYYNFFYGWVIRKIGGIPIDRKGEFSASLKPGDQLEGVISLIRAMEEQKFSIVITPQGTRKDDASWKSGFRRISLATELPVFPAAFNHSTKTVVLGDELPRLPKKAYLQYIRDWFIKNGNYSPVIDDEKFPQ
jgi:1-acyl-sn-glycerol-3-phosphate acyltransferase